MKVIILSPDYRSRIDTYIEFDNVCIRISRNVRYYNFERLYIWLHQIKDSQLPASIVTCGDEDNFIELTAEEGLNFRIDESGCKDDSEIHFSTKINASELIKAFYDGITTFIQDKQNQLNFPHPSKLSNINWAKLLSPPTTQIQDWQKRLLILSLYSHGGTMDGLKTFMNAELLEQLTYQELWSMVLRDGLDKIAMMARGNSGICELATLYRDLPIDIILGEIDMDWYEKGRIALNKEYELNQQGPQESSWIIRIARLKTLKIGQIIDGTIVGIKHYGIFVNIGGVNALLHISLISQIPVEQLDHLFKHGDWIRAMIIDLDIEKLRITLSTSDLEVEPGDMLSQPLKVYETAELMAERYYQNVLSKQNIGEDIIHP